MCNENSRPGKFKKITEEIRRKVIDQAEKGGDWKTGIRIVQCNN